MIDIMDGNMAVSHGAMLSRVQCMPCFPITPATEIIETMAEWSRSGKWNGQYRLMESEHAVMAAAIASEMVGARTFTATSSQGLELMHELLPIASGTRSPLVMANVCRGISAPITLWGDHTDFLSTRDFGWLMFSCATNQEVIDTVPIAYKVSEDSDVLLPSMLAMDGFVHSYTRSEVDMPAQAEVDRFLPRLRLKTCIDVDNPASLGIPAADEYSYFRVQVHKAQLNALDAIERVQGEWERRFGRRYGLAEKSHMDDADVAVVAMGANCANIRSAVEELRKRGKKAGLLRLRLIRPWPLDYIRRALSGASKVLVIDQDLAPGRGGMLYPEVRAATDGAVVSNFIAGLGGKPVRQSEYAAMISDALRAREPFRRFLI